MLLWTWQDKKLDIRDGSQKVLPRKWSRYTTEEHADAYDELYRRIGTDQFHWYFTSEESASEYKDELASRLGLLPKKCASVNWRVSDKRSRFC